jgi:hypothetical protein
MAVGFKQKKRGIFGMHGGGHSPQGAPMSPGRGMMREEKKPGLGTRLLGEGWEDKAILIGSMLQGNTQAIPNYMAQQQAFQQRAALQAEQLRQQAMLQAQQDQEWYRREGFKANLPTTMQRDFRAYQGMTPEEQAQYDQFRPVVVQGPMGPTAVPRSSLGGQRAPAAPEVGAIEDGYEFLGGDPANPSNWREVPRGQHSPQSRQMMDAMGDESTQDYMRRMGY